MYVEELFSVDVPGRPGEEIKLHDGHMKPRVWMEAARTHIGGAKASVEVARHERKPSRGPGDERKGAFPT